LAVRVSGFPKFTGVGENVSVVEVENPLTCTSVGTEMLGR
jgi:hypothetical protein